MHPNDTIRKDFSVIILAAGNSSRMGFPKLALKYSESQTFIEHIADEYDRFGCAEIILVVNVDNYKYLKDKKLQFPEKVKIVVNEHPEWHRFYSLKTGVYALSKKRKVFVHHVDNPFVNYNVLYGLLNNTANADYIYPEYSGRGGHPILLSEKVINDITGRQENQIHLKEFLNHYHKKKVKVFDESVLININTVIDYKKYFNWIEYSDE